MRVNTIAYAHPANDVPISVQIVSEAAGTERRRDLHKRAVLPEEGMACGHVDIAIARHLACAIDRERAAVDAVVVRRQDRPRAGLPEEPVLGGRVECANDLTCVIDIEGFGPRNARRPLERDKAHLRRPHERLVQR